jgi:hypothetical protein
MELLPESVRDQPMVILAGFPASFQMPAVPAGTLIGLLSIRRRRAACRGFGSPPPPVEPDLTRHLAVVGLAVVTALYVFLRIVVQWR